VVVRVHPGQANSAARKRGHNVHVISADDAVRPLGFAAPEEQRAVRPLPRVAFKVGEAAHVLGVSEDFFSTHIAPELRCVRRGRLKLFALRELERWMDENASRVLEDD
jgi:hypothetical protein